MDVVLHGLAVVVAWPAIGLMVLGVLLGLCFGAVPGLGGIVGMSILLPFSFGMEPEAAFAFLLGMYAVTTTSDSLPAVLLGVPGTAAGAATVIDGYPMAQRGEATRALGAAFSVSALGGILGAVALAVSIPFVKPLILAFAPPEYFMLGVLGLSCVGALSGDSLVKGLLGALLGLLLSTVGYSVQGGSPRYDFDLVYLLAGIPLVPMALGLFGLPEIIFLSGKNAAIAKIGDSGDRRHQMWLGIKDTFRNWGLVVRSSLIGIYVGLLPGGGGAVADWVAYGHAVQSARDKSQFGKGDVRGVIAPEAANHSVKGSALLPTVAFGIPATPGLAVMMGAFLIHGLRPGPEMLTTNLYLTISFIWTLVIANILGAALLMIWGNQLARITFMRGALIVPFIILFVFMGAWMSRNQMGDWVALIGFGLVGYIFKRAGWPRPPILLGFILGPIMETNLDITYQVMGWGFVFRPIVAVMIALLVAAALWALWKSWRGRNTEKAAWSVEIGGATDETLSLVLAAVIAVVFAAALYTAAQWTPDARFFPVVAMVPAVALTLFMLVRDGGIWLAAGRPGFAPDTPEFLRNSRVFLLFFALVGLTLVLDQLTSVALLVLAYLLLWARERPAVAFGQAAAAAVVLYGLFDRFLHVVWYPSAVSFF